MNSAIFHRLQNLRMATVEAGYAMDEQRGRFNRLRDRHTNGAAPEAVAVHQLFQTPAALAAELVSLIPQIEGRRILEPSAGLGRILDALQPFGPSEVVAVEIAPECTQTLYKQDREGVTIKQRDFLTLSSADLGGQFDAVAMNPPFTMRADIRHIQHALTMLKPGGTLAALCMDTRHRSEAFREMAHIWKQIPAGTFREAGTNTACVLLAIRKEGDL